MTAVVGRARPSYWNAHPVNADEWAKLAQAVSQPVLLSLPKLRETMHVRVSEDRIGGVKVFIIQPDQIARGNAERQLLHFHGGGYVFSSGEAGTREAILTAGFLRIKVISVDYRMPPAAPFPAALDDALTVWRALATAGNPRRIGVLGTSAGGAITLALVLRAKEVGLPLPAAIAPGTPWADLTGAGDTVRTNGMLDNVVVTPDGWLASASSLYANGHDLKDPLLSPVYGDLRGFPPTLLTSGTRDLFLSDTVRVHRRLRAAGVDARLNVFEGLSHAQYLADPTSEETQDYFKELALFFGERLSPSGAGSSDSR